MGIELLRVPANWQHPTTSDYKERDERWRIAYEAPRFERFRGIYMSCSWDAAMRDWWWDRIKHGFVRAVAYWPSVFGLIDPPFAVRWTRDEDDKAPDHYDYRPRWRERDRTHFQLYETVSEGTPISPVCASLEELAEWCASQKRPVWNGTAGMDRDAWLRFFGKGGWAPSMVYTPSRGVQTGVEFIANG